MSMSTDLGATLGTLALGTLPLAGLAWLARQGGPLGGLGHIWDFAVTEQGRIEEKGRGALAAKARKRSQLFTWTTKVHAPSWSMPAVVTCPAVRYEIEQRLKGTPRPTPQELLEVMQSLPQKCLACYAFNSGRYAGIEVVYAQRRRYKWWNSTPDEQVVATMVTAIKRSAHVVEPSCKFQRKINPASCQPEEGFACKNNWKTIGKYFRLFDSGDFQDVRDVRIWYEIARRMPEVHFWAPTTAWNRPEMLDELQRLNKLKNVAVRPSARDADVAAPTGLGLSGGSAVILYDSQSFRNAAVCPSVRKKAGCKGTSKGGCCVPHPDAGQKRCTLSLKWLHGKPPAGQEDVPRPDAHTPRTDEGRLVTSEAYRVLVGADGKGIKHFICAGDCTKCRVCWSKGPIPVAYVAHGPDAKNQRVMVKRFLDMRRAILPDAIAPEPPDEAELVKLYAKFAPAPESKTKACWEALPFVKQLAVEQAERKAAPRARRPPAGCPGGTCKAKRRSRARAR